MHRLRNNCVTKIQGLSIAGREVAGTRAERLGRASAGFYRERQVKLSIGGDGTETYVLVVCAVSRADVAILV